MKPLKRAILFALGVVGIVLIVITLVIVALWANDVREDREHIVLVKSETPVFAGAGDEACGGTRLTVAQSGVRLPVRRIRYWKECATLNIVLPDGREGYIVLGDGEVVVSPPLERRD
jgi:hypothetical protein